MKAYIVQSAFCSDQIDAHRLLVQVGAGRNTVSYNHNQVIYSQGEEAHFVFFVQEGSVHLTSVSDQGTETSLATVQQGQFFGEACLHDLPVRIASATAMGECRITSVTKGVMLSTIHGQPKLAKMFVDYLSNHNAWTRRDLLDHLVKFPAAGASLSRQIDSGW